MPDTAYAATFTFYRIHSILLYGCVIIYLTSSLLMAVSRGIWLQVSKSDSAGLHKEKYWPLWDFPGGPVVKTLCFQCRGHGFDPWSGN